MNLKFEPHLKNSFQILMNLYLDYLFNIVFSLGHIQLGFIFLYLDFTILPNTDD